MLIGDWPVPNAGNKGFHVALVEIDLPCLELVNLIYYFLKVRNDISPLYHQS